MNLQRLIEQHPAAPAAIMPILFVCLWLFVSATISVIGGWFSLAKVYRAQLAFDGTRWSGQSGQMRRLEIPNRQPKPQNLMSYTTSAYLWQSPARL